MENEEIMRVPLLTQVEQEEDHQSLLTRVWVESKKLWRIVGPAIIERLSLYAMNVITQAFAGHPGDLELASLSIANTVVVGLNYGLMLGMASALETLCGQAFGANRPDMLGMYLQRSWIVLFLCAIILLPMYFLATPFHRLVGQPEDLAVQAGEVVVWLIPLHFSFAFVFPLNRFLQCQLKNTVNAVFSVSCLFLHILLSCLLVYVFKLGLFGTAMTLNLSWWVSVVLLFGYVVGGGCPDSWKGFSMEAFSQLWDFIKLSAASGVMIWLVNVPGLAQFA